MEKCFDLALRKGQAGGEPKPTETNATHFSFPKKKSTPKDALIRSFPVGLLVIGIGDLR